MTLDELVSDGWRDHATDAEGVLARLATGAELVTEPKHLAALTGLVVHVAGEHLGRWEEGIARLETLERSPLFDASTPLGKIVVRGKAVLAHCAGDSAAEARYTATSRPGGSFPEASNRIRVLAVAASALAFQKRDIERAAADFEEAVALAAYGPTAADPATRDLAMTANNLAVELENAPTLTARERALMLRAASVALDFWRIAGGWMQEERAEYRLAMSHLKAGDAAGALDHAERCHAIVEKNGPNPGETFFALEALSKSRRALGDAAGARLGRDAMAALLPTIADEGFRAFCAGELAKLDASPAAR